MHKAILSDKVLSADKVPSVTLAFWAAKIAATTLGETGGDALSMTLGLGYAVSTLIFAGIFLIALVGQVSARRYHAGIYWFAIVATTTVGTTLSDFMDRTLGLGYTQSSLLLFSLVVLTLGMWKFFTGSISVSHIVTRKVECFYWTAILFSNTLGTALGDFLADTEGVGFGGGAVFFGGLIAVVAGIYLVAANVPYLLARMSLPLLFWSAFVLTRPLGATLGDLLTKPVAMGGLHLERIASSIVLAVFMVGCIVFTSLRRTQPDGEKCGHHKQADLAS